jgi:hypothetical protein
MTRDDETTEEATKGSHQRGYAMRNVWKSYGYENEDIDPT